MSPVSGAPGAVAARQILLIALLAVAASVARTVVGGQDLNFDLQTYHYYLGYSAFVDRFSLDFLPASFQGYQSPGPYALLYWLDSVGTPSFVNASIHAAIHQAKDLPGGSLSTRTEPIIFSSFTDTVCTPLFG